MFATGLLALGNAENILHTHTELTLGFRKMVLDDFLVGKEFANIEITLFVSFFCRVIYYTKILYLFDKPRFILLV